MTSNLASDEIIGAWEEGERQPERLRKKLQPLFENHFGAAFMGRVTLIPFMPLKMVNLRKNNKM